MKTLALEHYSSSWASNSTPSHYHYHHPSAKHTKSLDSSTASYFQSCVLGSSSKFSSKFSGISSKSATNVSRSLFGPSDPSESKRVQREEFASQRYADRSRWNFDFQQEKPTAGRYDWSKVKSNVKLRHASGDSSHSSWSSLSKKFQESSLDKRNNNNSNWPSAYEKDCRSPDMKKKF